VRSVGLVFANLVIGRGELPAMRLIGFITCDKIAAMTTKPGAVRRAGH
jgi:hypothetical protein